MRECFKVRCFNNKGRRMIVEDRKYDAVKKGNSIYVLLHEYGMLYPFDERCFEIIDGSEKNMRDILPSIFKD